MNTKAIGDITEAMVVAAFLRAGTPVLRPVGDNLRYDLVVEMNGKFLRVQCKTARLRDDCLFFEATSCYNHRGRPRKGYIGEADLFAAYSPLTERVYLIEVDKTPPSGCVLRLYPFRQRRVGGRWAKDFDIGPGPVKDTYSRFSDHPARPPGRRGRKDAVCVECPTKITRFAKTGKCNGCSKKSKRQWPTDSEIQRMVKASSCFAVAKQLGVPDSTLRKRIRVRNIRV